MKQIEILAPAGGMESLIAGVRCGADAVYLGGKAFSARQNAGNFNQAELEEAVAYCHARGVQVYAAVNTLVADKELEQALFAVQQMLEAGCDALILQDLGLAQLVKKLFPQAVLHASTQMAAATPDGFRKLYDLGFCRAVLPRELTKEEITQIHAASPIALEGFVHGALCMCMSGQCYFSAMLGSRSGNRGLCAQPCRLPFYVDKPEGHNLSLKDLSLIPNLQEMARSGVSSFKIEGRMKRPEYVAAAVTACREAADGTLQPGTLDTLKSVFSRSGFTDGYFEGRRGAGMFGTRGKEDVVQAKEVLGRLAALYAKERPSVPVTFHMTIRQGANAVLTASTKEETVTVTSALLPEKALHQPMDAGSVGARLCKCGGTPYLPKIGELDIEEGLILPASELNRMRREALDTLAAKRAYRPTTVQTPQFVAVPAGTAGYQPKQQLWRGVFDSYSQVPDQAQHLDQIFLPVWEEPAAFRQAQQRFTCVGAVLPRGLFGREEQLKQDLQRAAQAGVDHVLAGNLGAAYTALQMGFTVHGDFGLNAFNSQTLHALQQMGLASQTASFELKAEQINRLARPLPVGAIVYGRLPLMLTRNCPVQVEQNCQACNRTAELTDRKGVRFPVRCAYGCSELLNSRPVYMADKQKDLALEFATLLFTTESREEAGSVLEACLAGAPPEGLFTRGLYYRGVE